MKLNFLKRRITKITVTSFLIIGALFLFVEPVLAQDRDLNTIVYDIVGIIKNGIIPIIIGIALLVFLWGAIKYGLSKDDKTRQDAIWVIITGLIILFVMVSVWGLVWLLADFFGIDIYSGAQLQTKTIPLQNLSF